MFKIDKESNQISPLEAPSFSELGFKERAHLQEWIAKSPSCLGEELLIIQKEFSGFSDTQERLDLLALDKQGSIVIVENKLDDTGRDVTWQALKYASYASSLTKDNVKNIYQDYLLKSGSEKKAEDLLSEFFEVDDFNEINLNKGFTQRVILIAANFRKEVTSTVLWLMNYKLRIQCFKVTPYRMNEDFFLNVEQIIPTRDAEDFMIGLAEKSQAEAAGATEEKARHAVRRAFWKEVIDAMNKHSTLYQNISPSKDSWISAGTGFRGIGFNLVAGKTYCRAEVYIDRGIVYENNWIFDQLRIQKENIEADFGGALVWEPLENRQACRIKAETAGNIYEREMWPEMIEFMVDAMLRIEKAFRSPLDEISQRLKSLPPGQISESREGTI